MLRHFDFRSDAARAMSSAVALLLLVELAKMRARWSGLSIIFWSTFFAARTCGFSRRRRKQSSSMCSRTVRSSISPSLSVWLATHPPQRLCSHAIKRCLSIASAHQPRRYWESVLIQHVSAPLRIAWEICPSRLWSNLSISKKSLSATNHVGCKRRIVLGFDSPGFSRSSYSVAMARRRVDIRALLRRWSLRGRANSRSFVLV